MAPVLRALPKADLHLHLDGALRPQTYVELARALPSGDGLTLEEAERAITVGPGVRSLAEFLTRFPVINRVTQTEAALRRITREALEDAHRSGVRYAELRAAPWLHTEGGLTLEQVVEAILQGIQEAGRQWPILARLILVVMRGRPEEENRQVVELAARYRDHGVAGVDLAGDETAYPPELYVPIFRRARDAGLAVTIHAGEAAGPEAVWVAVRELGAWRIGHGTRAVEDPALLDHLREHRIWIESCLTSNLQTGAVRRLQDHPFGRFLAEGVPVTLNSDDPGVSRIELAGEWSLAAGVFELDFDRLARLALNGVEAAFVPETTRAMLRAEFENRIEQLHPRQGASGS
ncbi:adenosine deaminase [Limnochorda pilosa]|uniref:adenosine deaminase n=1 Tax=Limnochorda pilosa TaxID=1555112 RepID=A0A0K2SP21_LIMPI|nr:adenosine deaminase [Limnochorda pilosa]